VIFEMKKIAFISLVSAPALLSTLPATAQEPDLETGAGPALWKVADEDTTIYLFGSIHLLPKDVDWLRGPLKAAFEESREFLTDVDVTRVEAFGPTMMAAATLSDGQTLRSLMSNEERTRFEAAVASLGLPMESLDKLEPWIVSQLLQTVILMRSGYDPANGVDMMLTRLASEKQRSWLETLEFQLERHDTTPMDQQLAYLADTVGWTAIVREWNDRMVALWLAGDAAALADHIATAYSDPDYYDRMLTERNANWATWIDQRLDTPGTVFIAVGAGHLGGRGSVQDMLAGRGIETVRIL
jgi:uncharacterized protein YbaP (TraB family)